MVLLDEIDLQMGVLSLRICLIDNRVHTKFVCSCGVR
jgi:hypothetical protein